MSHLRSIRWHFTRGLVAGAPAQRGIYALWDGEQIVYVGRADGHETIRGCLSACMRGEADLHGARPTHFSWEITSRPRLREAQVLAELEVRPAPGSFARPRPGKVA